MHPQANISKHSGLSLIELLVSMVIGLFLIGGLANVYLSTKGSDSIRSEVSAMEENARIALSSIRQIIGHAGYPSMRKLQIDEPFYSGTLDIPNPDCRGDSSSVIRINAILNKKTRDTNQRDSVVVVSVADSPNNNFPGQIITDCMAGAMPLECSSDEVNGIYNPADAKLYSYLHINTRDGNRSLRCTGSRGGTQPLAENIYGMQFLYGVIDSSGNYQYRNAEDMTASAQWSNVVSVQVGILVRSEKEILEKQERKVFILLDQKITTANDRRLYRVYTTSIVLPNRASREL